MRVGYVRVSSVDQNTARQLDGVQLDRTFEDHASGKDVERPAFKEMMEFVREGDLIIVHSMDRLARNLDDLRNTVRTLTAKGVEVEFVKERITFTAKDNPMATLLMSVMGAFAEFERSLIKERQAEGIAIAKKKGVYKGGKLRLTDEQVAEMRRLLFEERSTKNIVARKFGVTRKTVYNYLARTGTEGGVDA
jgi:DNA invertase Pin-like site-specific DNA recombinase